MPLIGNFVQDGDVMTFHGKTVQVKDRTSASIGQIMSNHYFAGGTIEAVITFDQVNEQSSAEVILAYDPQKRFFLTAGLGSLAPVMFGIREFTLGGGAGAQMNSHAMGGTRENLEPGQSYRVRVRAIGSVVSLDVNDVHVLTATIPYPLKQSQVGIWCFADHKITISNFKVTPVRPRAFTVMQFSSPFNEIYSNVIKKVCERNGLESVRADEITGPGLIIGDVIQQILDSKVIIADITHQNANVFFEVGYAFALNKPTILIAEKPTNLPFDLSPFRVLFYENSIAGKEKVEEALEKHIKSIMGTGAP